MNIACFYFVVTCCMIVATCYFLPWIVDLKVLVEITNVTAFVILTGLNVPTLSCGMFKSIIRGLSESGKLKYSKLEFPL